jgi:hypothetical protein
MQPASAVVDADDTAELFHIQMQQFPWSLAFVAINR